MFFIKNADIKFGECPYRTLPLANVPHTENSENLTKFLLCIWDFLMT